MPIRSHKHNEVCRLPVEVELHSYNIRLGSSKFCTKESIIEKTASLSFILDSVILFTVPKSLVHVRLCFVFLVLVCLN